MLFSISQYQNTSECINVLIRVETKMYFNYKLISQLFFNSWINNLVNEMSKKQDYNSPESVFRCLVLTDQKSKTLKTLNLQQYKTNKSRKSSHLRNWNHELFGINLLQIYLLLHFHKEGAKFD